MNRINVQYKGRNIVFSYRDITRKSGDVEKVIDIQTLQEIYNEEVYRLKLEHLSGSRVVVDVGANIGGFSLMAASLGASKVYCIEPNPDNVKYLSLNINQNNWEHIIEIVPKALWSQNKTLKMQDLDRDSRAEDLAHLETDYSKAVTGNGPENETFTASAITLEDMMEAHNIAEIDFLKMDIEWSEYEIIPSWSDETMRKIKNIALEFHGVDEAMLGKLVAHLTREFCVETLGSHERGGFIFARRY